MTERFLSFLSSSKFDVLFIRTIYLIYILTLDGHYLNNLFEKDPIAWPKMIDNNSWEQLDSAVNNLLVGAASVFEGV